MRRHNIYWAFAVVVILGSFVMILFNADHRRDHNVPGASTTAGQNSLVPDSGFAKNPTR
jgi:uncharacterized membrane protein YoaK (UPF0700 family)